MAVNRRISYFFVTLSTWNLFILSAFLPLAANARPDNLDYFSIVQKTFTVPPGGLTCEKIAKKTGSPLADLLYLNQDLPALCGSVANPLTVTEGWTVALVLEKTKTPKNGNRVPCTAVYSTVKGDSCKKIASKFSDSSNFFDVETLTLLNFESELNCSNPTDLLDSRKMICIQRTQTIPNNDYLVKEGDHGCEFLYQNKTNAVDFFSLNPGIDCDNLIPGDLIRITPEPDALTKPSNEVVPDLGACAPVNLCVSANKGKIITLKRATACSSLKTTYYKTDAKFCEYDGPSFVKYCRKDASVMLPINKALCVP